MRTVRCSSRLLGRGVSARGVSTGGCLPGGSARHPLLVNIITDTCENITLPQLRCDGNQSEVSALPVGCFWPLIPLFWTFKLPFSGSAGSVGPLLRVHPPTSVQLHWTDAQCQLRHG